jgi:hypothetical protein
VPPGASIDNEIDNCKTSTEYYAARHRLNNISDDELRNLTEEQLQELYEATSSIMELVELRQRVARVNCKGLINNKSLLLFVV